MEEPQSPEFDPQSPVMAPMTLVTLMSNAPAVLRTHINTHLTCDGWDRCFFGDCHCLTCFAYGSTFPVHDRYYVEIVSFRTCRYHSQHGWICSICADDRELRTEERGIYWCEPSQLYWANFASDIAEDAEAALETAFAAAIAATVASQAVRDALNSTDITVRGQRIAEARAAVSDSITAAELAATFADLANEKVVADPFVGHEAARLAQEASISAAVCACTAIDRAATGQPNRAAADVLGLVRRHPTHPDSPQWAAKLREMLGSKEETR